MRNNVPFFLQFFCSRSKFCVFQFHSVLRVRIQIENVSLGREGERFRFEAIEAARWEDCNLLSWADVTGGASECLYRQITGVL